ncbi:MAG: mechanosensitive ion channel family protein, partial [Polyangiaceae bacterium]
VLWVVLKRALKVLDRTELDETARAFIMQVVKYAVFTVGVVSALGQLGVNTASLLTSLGVAGLTLGFAARDTLSNLISGLFIFWDRPFVVNDLIELGGQYGRVMEITMRSTRVVTNDGRMLAIPNSQIVNSTVASYTNFPNLRVEVGFTVGVGEDLHRIRELLLDLVEGDERFLDEPAPSVVVTALNDYNCAMDFRVWLENEREHIPVRFEMRQKIFETLREAGVEMPYETLQLAPMDVRTKSVA